MNTYDTPSPVTAELRIPAGRIQVIAADRADTTVEVLPANAAKNRDVKAAEQVSVSYADAVVRVHAPEKVFGNSGSVEVTVKLPAGSKVEAKAAACELRGVGRLGEVSFDGAQGRVKIDEAASVQLKAVDGDVEVGRLNGSAEISTTRGDITVAEASSGKVVLRTVSGNIDVTAAAGVSAALDAGAMVGRISNSLKNAGSTELEISATTTQGDITARSL